MNYAWTAQRLKAAIGRHIAVPVLLACYALFTPSSLANFDQRLLYEKTSAYNTIVVMENEDGVRELRFGRNGVRQSAIKPGSPEHLILPYAPVALVGLALSDEPRRFLIIGAGGGTLPMFLHKFYPKAFIDVVDIDPEVVNVAKKFFGFREDERLRAHVSDGRRFVEKSQQKYDVIFLDAYGSDSIPLHLTTQEFLTAVRHALAPRGLVVSNLWGRSVNPLYDAMVRTYQEVFSELFVLDVSGTANKILLALPWERSLNQEDLIQLARKVSAMRRLPFDLGESVRHGFLDANGKDPAVRVLLDRDLKRVRRAP